SELDARRSELLGTGVAPYGISRDSPWSHVAWGQGLGIDVPPLSGWAGGGGCARWGSSRSFAASPALPVEPPSWWTETASSAAHGGTARPRFPTSTCSSRPLARSRSALRPRCLRRHAAGKPLLRERLHLRRRGRRRRARRRRSPPGRLPLLARGAPARARGGALDRPLQLPAARRPAGDPGRLALRPRLLAPRRSVRPGRRLGGAPARDARRG